MKFDYRPKGVCSQNIQIDMDKDVIKSVKFLGGCNGNGKGIGALCKGMKASDAINRMRGISCNGRKTSCPDQLSKALELYLKEL